MNRTKNDIRYFICVGGFRDETLFFRYRGPGRGKSIHRDGTAHQSKISLRMALTAVKSGSWREITGQQANNLLAAQQITRSDAIKMLQSDNAEEAIAKDIAHRVFVEAHDGKTPEQVDEEMFSGTGEPSPPGIMKP